MQYCYTDYITLNPDLAHLSQKEALKHWNTSGRAAMRLCNKAQLIVTSEFGPEIILYACYYYYLFKNGLFFNNTITTYKGMKDFYYFINPTNIVEKEEQRRWICPKQRPFLVNGTEHVHQFDQRYWYPIPYKVQYHTDKFSYAKPLIVIQNKYNNEWEGGPVNYFSVETLDTMILMLKDKYQIVYIRPRASFMHSSFSTDHSIILDDLKDYELIVNKYADAVILFDDMLTSMQMIYNRLKLELFASCVNYISVQGGNAHMISLFYEKLLVLHKRGFEYNAGAYTGWYLDASPCPNKTVRVAQTDNALLSFMDMFVDIPPQIEKIEIPIFTRGTELEPVDKFYPICYDEPIQKDMAVILVFFNPSHSVRIIQNLLMVKHYLDIANIPYFIGELAFFESAFVLNASDNVFQVRSTSYMFYKENLIKLVEMQIPTSFTKLCMIDADIMFDNPQWYSVISRQLDTHDVCQPFIKTHLLGIDFKIEKSRTNIVDSLESTVKWENEHPGHIWAFTREWYRAAEISDMTVVGGGDFFLLTAIRDIKMDHDNIKFYASIFHTYAAKKTSCHLNIYHLNHGLLSNRQYLDRITMMEESMKQIGLENITQVLTRREDGLLEWRPEYRDAMNKRMYSYFCGRNDDATSATVCKAMKFYPIRYVQPSNQDMAVILVFFNPNPYNRIIQNILMVKNYMDTAGIPYFIAELAFENKPFLFKADSNIFQYRSDSYMFYKENLIKAIEPKIPSSFTKLCIMDADIFFDKPDWYSIVSNTLNRVNITQPFKRAVWLTGDFTDFREKGNCIDGSGSVIQWEKEHPGFVWAFDRKWFQKSNFCDKSICIGGDTIIHDFVKKRNTAHGNFYKKYFDANMNTDGIVYDSCSMTVWHLNHGSLVNRQYVNIIDIMINTITTHNIRTMNDVILQRTDAIYEWSTPFYKELFNGIMKQYFKERDEDNMD